VVEKLLLAVGKTELMESLPAAALVALGDEPAPIAVARLALAVDGYGVLERHKRALERRGLQPPGQWAGTSTAREWVRRLSFPVEYAGFRGIRPEPDVEIPGPPVLGDLHDYQRNVADQVRRMLDPGSERRRGLVALPTGAGKTRIAVQALAEHLAANYEDVLVVWVAESQELCEQAVQTWSLVWRAVGSPGRPLGVSRLWGSNSVTEQTGPQVVVATVSKLQQIVGRDGWEREYGWLKRPVVIVIDEAHRSIAPEYTRLISAVGEARNVAEMTTPLLGLTATPYRGFSTEETRRLSERYHGNLLDDGVFPDNDVYGFLQQRGVLARVRQVVLAGSSIEFTGAELDQVAQGLLPVTFGKRLGLDEHRNAAIVESVQQLAPNASALLFASSVENARVLAALLTYNGVESRAIASDTSSAARRRYIDDFREGRLRVLTNYGVFTEGFDVPSVDAVYVTRPTFSPNLYQQMIGRGLRGRMNGGKDEVLVVNVEDNITNYGEQYAFRHFEHLWNKTA
jgi:superfamily II DNA or RNA helicase